MSVDDDVLTAERDTVPLGDDVLTPDFDTVADPVSVDDNVLTAECDTVAVDDDVLAADRNATRVVDGLITIVLELVMVGVFVIVDDGVLIMVLETVPDPVSVDDDVLTAE